MAHIHRGYAMGHVLRVLYVHPWGGYGRQTALPHVLRDCHWHGSGADARTYGFSQEDGYITKAGTAGYPAAPAVFNVIL